MKKKFALLLLIILVYTSCSEDNDDNLVAKNEVNTSFKFSNNWDGTAISSSNFENTEYTNANGEVITITRLRYLISNVTFTKANGESTTIEGYKLIDVTNDDLEFNPEMKIPTGVYSNVSFTYGFKTEDNVTGLYLDLNSVSFQVPLAALGGGYHYMQFDGKYSNSSVTDAPFNYHNIRAVNPGMNPTFPDQNTFIVVDLGPATITDNVEITVNSNIAEWFKNPNQWDLNTLNQVLMPNPDAQLLMNQNGQNVFTLETISQ